MSVFGERAITSASGSVKKNKTKQNKKELTIRKIFKRKGRKRA